MPATKQSRKSAVQGAPKAKRARQDISQSAASAKVVGADTMVSTKAAAEILALTPRRLQQLVSEGALASAGRGRFRLGPLVQSYAGHLRKQLEEAREDDSDDAIRFERARKLRIENDREERLLIETEEAIATLEDIVGTIRAELSGLPVRATRDMDLRRKLEKDVAGILERTIERLGKRLAALQAGDAAFEADAEDAAG